MDRFGPAEIGDPQRWRKTDDVDLLHEGHDVRGSPMLDDLAVLDADDVDAAEFDAAAGGRDAHQFTLMRSGQDHVCASRFPSTSAGSMVLALRSGNGRPHRVDEEPDTVLGGRLPGQGIVIDKVITHQFIDEGEISVPNHLCVKPLDQSSSFSHFRLLAGERPNWIPRRVAPPDTQPQTHQAALPGHARGTPMNLESSEERANRPIKAEGIPGLRACQDAVTTAAPATAATPQTPPRPAPASRTPSAPSSPG